MTMKRPSYKKDKDLAAVGYTGHARNDKATAE